MVQLKQGSQMLDDDSLSIVLTKFSNLLDVHEWKSASKGFNELCTKAIKDKCPDNKRKKFETGTELRRAVFIYYNIKYRPDSYRGNEVQRRKDADFIASTYGWNMNEWNVSQVKDFSDIFEFKYKFNEEIGSWDTSNATTMSCMFKGAESFNQDIGRWNTSKVTTMSDMFNRAYSFNRDISGWDTSSVTDMCSMFCKANSFNRPIGRWITSSVMDMSFMFALTPLFNQAIGRWDTSSVRDMKGMFYGATSFNQNISTWNVSSVFGMQAMFHNATSFDQQDINVWDARDVHYDDDDEEEDDEYHHDSSMFKGMFVGATSFDARQLDWFIEDMLDEYYMGVGPIQF